MSAPDATSYSLLERLQKPGTDWGGPDWDRLARTCRCLLEAWGRQNRLPNDVADDVIQEVLVKLHRVLPDYVPQPGRPFRAWLFGVARNVHRDYVRRPGTRRQPPPGGLSGVTGTSEEDAVDELDEAAYLRVLMDDTLPRVLAEFDPGYRHVFHAYAVLGWPAERAAAAHGVSEGQVYVIKSRVMKRLREELKGLLE